MRLLIMFFLTVFFAVTAGGSPISLPRTPRRLAEQTKTIIGAEVIERDFEAGTMTLKVTDVFKGEFKPQKIEVLTTEDTRDEPIFLDEGQSIAAFVGSDHKADKVLFYTSQGLWQEARIINSDPVRWLWTAVHDDSQSLWLPRAFSGDTSRLVEMMADLKRGAYYFPSQLSGFFKYSPLVVGKFDKPLGGVALYDVDGDGDLDAYGCNAAGNRLYLQGKPLEFTDATDKLGLAGIASASCSFADADADGRAELLADGVIYTQNQDGTFAKTDWLPTGANEAVKSAAFVELNGDGYPDIVVSQIGRGLRAYLNPGADGGPYRDVTETMGLAKKDCGAGGTGFFAPGDWNHDGMTDLFYLAGAGLLLTQAAEAAFEPTRLESERFNRDKRPKAGVVGVFAPVWRRDSTSLLVARQASFDLIATHDERLRNVIKATGDLDSEPSEDPTSVLCEDLDADGYVDVLTGTPNDNCAYYCNRGYGVFVRADSYAFPQDSVSLRTYMNGARGLAAGDVNNDGANDILLGGVDGNLTLLVNDTLSLRKPPKEKTFHLYRKRYNVTILAIDVAGPIGVVGAKLMLKDADGQPVALRVIGNNVNVGSCSSDRVNLAVREDGEYTLTVIWSDGMRREVDVTIDERRRIPLTVERSSPPMDG